MGEEQVGMDAVSSLLGMQQKPEEDPNETLINKRILGLRPFNRRFMKFSLMVCGGCLLFTLAETFYLISLLTHGLLVLILGGMAINELIDDYVKNRQVRRNFVIFIASIYSLMFIGLITMKLLVKAI